MKNKRILVDVTDPDNVFVHRSKGARKGRKYVVFQTRQNTTCPEGIFCNTMYGKAFVIPNV